MAEQQLSEVCVLDDYSFKIGLGMLQNFYIHFMSF